MCLRAERASGCLEFQRQDLARAVGKSRSTPGRCLRELAGKGVCELEAAASQHGVSRLRVRPRHWPCEVREEPARKRELAQREGPGTAGEAGAYVAEVRRLFRQPACVQGRFGKADERLAADWQRAGVALETVRRAILLGSVRKSVSLLDRAGGEPVRSLRYFAGLQEEVRTESFPPSYWRHVEFNLRRCERLWRNRPVEGTGSARPDLAQADSSGGPRDSLSGAKAGDKEATG